MKVHKRHSHCTPVIQQHYKRIHIVASASTSTPATRSQISRRQLQLQKLDSEEINVTIKHDSFLADGWGVSIPEKTSADSVQSHSKQDKLTKKKHIKSAAFDMKSEKGLIGLGLLQEKLVGEGRVRSSDLAELKEKLNLQSKSSRKGRNNPRTAAILAAKSGNTLNEDLYYEEEEAEELTGPTPSFELLLGDDGATELVNYDSAGNISKRNTINEEDGADDATLENIFGPDMEGWEALLAENSDEEEQEEDVDLDVRPEIQKAKRMDKRGVDSRGQKIKIREGDWGLDELAQGKLSLSSQVRQLDPAQEDSRGLTTQWGGSNGASFVDYAAQEEVLRRIFKPHKVAQMLAHQREVEASTLELKRKTSGHVQMEKKLHSQLRIIAGKAAGKRILSSKGQTTRPMMEKVRQAIFNIIQSQAGTVNSLPSTARWLDLFAGTGSIGLEALSRGAAQCSFVEMDPWVSKSVLSKNVSTCGFHRQSNIHTMKAEAFLQRALDIPRFAGGAFDFISVCPPYLKVSYPEIFSLLENSSLIHPNSIVFVEYAKQLKSQIPDRLNSLVKVRDRKYGRTYIAVYAGESADINENDDDTDEN